VQERRVLHQVDVFGGLARDGYVLINTSRTFDALGVGEFARSLRAARLCTVPATELALKHVGRPLPNAALLGGFAAVSGRISLDAVAAAIREKFGGKVAEGNVAAAREAYAFVRDALREISHAEAD
jgi:pyruvate ferredoxin oxidoreductase gamma subunit